jgi:hypothetical protein
VFLFCFKGIQAHLARFGKRPALGLKAGMATNWDAPLTRVLSPKGARAWLRSGTPAHTSQNGSPA